MIEIPFQCSQNDRTMDLLDPSVIEENESYFDDLLDAT